MNYSSTTLPQCQFVHHGPERPWNRTRTPWWDGKLSSSGDH